MVMSWAGGAQNECREKALSIFLFFILSIISIIKSIVHVRHNGTCMYSGSYPLLTVAATPTVMPRFHSSPCQQQ